MQVFRVVEEFEAVQWPAPEAHGEEWNAVESWCGEPLEHSAVFGTMLGGYPLRPGDYLVRSPREGAVTRVYSEQDLYDNFMIP